MVSADLFLGVDDSANKITYNNFDNLTGWFDLSDQLNAAVEVSSDQNPYILTNRINSYSSVTFLQMMIIHFY